LNCEYGLETSLLIKGMKRLQLSRPGKLGSVVCQLLSKLVEQNRLTVIKDGDWCRSPKVVQSDNDMSVSPEDVNRALLSAGVPPLDQELTMAHLRSIGATETEQDSLPLWNIPISQWNTYAKTTSKLKIFKGA